MPSTHVVYSSYVVPGHSGPPEKGQNDDVPYFFSDMLPDSSKFKVDVGGICVYILSVGVTGI